jgi:histidine triad (HIT) family protein
MSEPTLFDKIVDGSIPSYQVWEDDSYLAFLTPFGNVAGFTVVVPKQNPGDNYISVDDTAYTHLLLAAKKVAALLQKAFSVERVGLVIEGEGVPHLHVKLIPMHGLTSKSVHRRAGPVFYDQYPGYLTTVEGPEMSAERLKEIQAQIKAAL